MGSRRVCPTWGFSGYICDSVIYYFVFIFFIRISGFHAPTCTIGISGFLSYQLQLLIIIVELITESTCTVIQLLIQVINSTVIINNSIINTGY